MLQCVHLLCKNHIYVIHTSIINASIEQGAGDDDDEDFPRDGDSKGDEAERAAGLEEGRAAADDKQSPGPDRDERDRDRVAHHSM